MKYTNPALLIALVATTLIAGTILGASAAYQFGANPVLMKNAQAQNDEMIVPEVGIKQGGGAGVEEPMVVPLPEGGKQGPLPLPSGKPVLAPLPAEEPAAAPVQECSPEEIAVINESNKTGTEVITTVEENVMDTETVEEITEVVENVTTTVEESVTNNATSEEVETVAEEVVTVVEETPAVQESEEVKGGIIALLTGLVEAQNYNENLSEDERQSLQENLEITKQQLSLAFS